MKDNKYDSTTSTLEHIKRVNELLINASIELLKRAQRHDATKLGHIEKPLFDKWTPILNGLVYGTPKYQESLDNLKVALDHHYAHNSHHPQFYDNGIDGFDLFDLIEMFLDWIAAGERNTGGSIFKSIDINKERFNMSEQLVNIFNNTAKNLNYEK